MSARLVRFFDGVAVSIVVVCLAALAPLLATPAHACPTVASGLPALSEPAVGRWQEFTGREATLEGDGRSFAEIEAQRLG